MTQSVTVFVPCRAGSQRVPHKNTRPFAGHPDGLVGLKLDQLERLAGARTIVLDSDDPAVLAIGARRRRDWQGQAALVVRQRPSAVSDDGATTDALIRYALATLPGDAMLWTHVTSPFCDENVLTRALDAFHQRAASGHDSVMAVTRVRTFVWDRSGPINYDVGAQRWPRTQDVAPLDIINSAFFLTPMALGRQCSDRIGKRPLRLPLSDIEAFDIDWPDDFVVAEQLWTALMVTSNKNARRS